MFVAIDSLANWCILGTSCHQGGSGKLGCRFLAQRLHHVQGIRRSRSVLIPRIIQDTYQWPPPDDSFAAPETTPSVEENLGHPYLPQNRQQA